MQKYSYRILLFLISVLLSGSAYADSGMTATIHSIPGYGTWDNPASWSEERIPTSDDIVEINGTMAMNVSPTIAGLVINGGGELLGSYSSMVVNGDIENHGTFSVTILTISGTGTHILDFHNNPFIGNIFLEGDISILGDLNITGSFGLRGTTHNIHLEDGRGITAKAGFINGAIIISGTNTFLKTQGYTHTFTVTGSLDHYIFDTKNTTQLASELYTYCSSISAKSIEITPGSSVYTHPNCLEPRYTFNTEKLSIASGASLNIQQNFQVNGNILNDGTISGSATLFVQGNLENNGDIQGTTNLNISGNISNSSTRVSLSILTISGTGIHILDFHNNPFTGSIFLEGDISLIGDLNLAGSLTLGGQTHTVTLENGHGITAKEGVINGTLIVSGSGGFLKTQGYTHTFTVTGSLDRYIFDTKNTVLAPTESYLYRSDISAKNIVITTSSSLYNYPTGENASILNTEKFIISSGSIFDVQRNLQVNGNLLNDGTISGPATLFVQGNLENDNIWTAPTHISWLSTDWATSYTIRFDPGSSTGFTTTATSYDISDKLSGSYYYQVEPDNAPAYVRRCINMIGCIGGGNTNSGIVILKPTGLSQHIRSPGLYILQPIRPGEKIGKYQSGSGVILSGTVNTSEPSKLVVDVYRVGDTTPREFSGGYSTNSIKQVTLPYLGAGEYRWKARVETVTGDVSDWVDFGTDNPEEIDYILYEGFEPYPYGYQFVNNGPGNGLLDNPLTGGIGEKYWTGERYKIDGNKWTIFNKIFPEYTFSEKYKMFDAFEQSGFQSGTGLKLGNCFGMATSAAIQYTHPYLLEQYFPSFSAKIGTGTIWDRIEQLHTNFFTKRWDVYDDTIETILELQLTQYDDIISKRVHDYTGAIDAYNILKDNPDTTYVLNFWGTGGDGLYGGHAVVPYKVESFPDSKRIYIWDNNYPVNLQHTGAIEYGYNQYVDIPNIGRWKVSGYNKWKSFDKISLVSLDSIDYLLNQLLNGAKQSLPMGFNGYDMLATVSGKSDLIITDSIGRVSGFSGGTILEGIPGVQVIVPLNATLTGTTDNTWKQIYLPQKQDGLIFKVSGKTGEQYDLMIAGGDYYTKVDGVTISTGQSDAYKITGTGIIIDFDQQKTGKYSLLTDNFQDTLTGTIFLSGITATPELQKLSYDWYKVLQNSIDAVLYQIDSNNDGVYDITSNFSATPKSIQAKSSISGYVIGDTNASMAGWKVCIDKNQSDTCEESSEIFAITNNTGYYEFMNLDVGSYSILLIPHKNWRVVSPQSKSYRLTLSSGQNIINLNFENIFLKGKNK